MEFASDNTAPVPPEVLAALAEANAGHAPGYGADRWTEAVRDAVRAAFEAPEAAVYLVGTGTAANALSLALFCPPWGAVFCHRHAHVEEDECGAPEFFTGGAKLVHVEGAHGRMTPAALDRAIAATGRIGVHGVQPGMVSLTNVTEAGTVHSAAETAALAAVAKAHGLPVHLDGARFANAVVATGARPADLTWRAGVDVLSLGGTKNGLIGVEAVVLFDPARAWEFELRRKRGGHLFSKHRYLAAQMAAWFEGGLWLDLAGRANAAAARLAAGIASAEGAALVHPAEANMVFATLPRGLHRRLQAAGARYYLWPAGQSLEGPEAEPVGCRLVCSWSTTAAELDAFLTHLRQPVPAG
jgi:threonine aldolase